MTRKEFLKDIAVMLIDGANEITGLMFLRRLRFRLIFGVWCKHHSWTPWEKFGDHWKKIRQCEGCCIRQTK